jgi:hypothetical protein
VTKLPFIIAALGSPAQKRVEVVLCGVSTMDREVGAAKKNLARRTRFVGLDQLRMCLCTQRFLNFGV